MTGRNDNYGGDFKSRLENCIVSLVAQLHRFDISSEIIFVNYNPLPSPNIENFIAWPKPTALVKIKIVTVPSELHVDFVIKQNVKDIPVNEYLGKNVGIRRATGSYILCMNPDILFPDAVWSEFLKEQNENRYFRANRFDFQNLECHEKQSIDEIKNQVVKIWVKGFSHSFSARKVSTLFFKRIKLHQKWKIAKYEAVRKLNFLWQEKLHAKAENKFHCNVSGDFMLMHQKHWIKLKGYNETKAIALHVDALMVVSAAILNLKEYVLCSPIYHQEHERRFDANQENEIYREAYLNFQNDAQKMIITKSPLIYNSNDWGLAIFELPTLETTY